jgi:hypothetical protein
MQASSMASDVSFNWSSNAGVELHPTMLFSQALNAAEVTRLRRQLEEAEIREEVLERRLAQRRPTGQVSSYSGHCVGHSVWSRMIHIVIAIFILRC